MPVLKLHQAAKITILRQSVESLKSTIRQEITVALV